ncbi:5'-methylthioadenosine/S-adenosylhomocysteine nucleosidase family protein [Mycoplasma zalophi]|uniref:5'-methylthioadenosine/S-adenosylhomocysteine nucleosidase n=1 Tax=Mycoplasma zalophi TaxID=191287 RepID=A0ABS6DQ10_9MOLU|nr:5'-methylthioadenosine/S-adenosylhomocysteine nucleosidase [Mycoplasma zalophi]MBU4690965.1 5'-methylthioadenosine/S-adenosylhomocysteine nucleosidase [Mycoplasma zalophi]MBU4692256.1 5'-methylthioadenosine/S-adenosylhomocysteine nucleosidase [Mycoplasma zalophi]
MKLIIAAELQEVESFFKILSKKMIFETKNIQIYECIFNNQQFILTISGVGKVNASVALNTTLNKYKNISKIVNIGTAGSLDNDIEIAKAFLINTSQYWDVDLTALPNYKIGQLPNMPQLYSSSTGLNTELLQKINLEFANSISGDSFISKENIKNYDLKSFSLVDMESTSLLQNCYLLNKDISLIKVVSDHIFKDNNSSDYQENIKKCSQVICNILIKIFS